MSRPWIEDAKEYQAVSDLSQSGIYLTPLIRDYLDHENKHRTIVSAPKGCGKTLLIKHKRRMLQDSSGWELLPRHRLVSGAPGFAPGFDNDQMNHIRGHGEYWSMLWQIAIALTVLREDRHTAIGLTSPNLQRVLRSDDIDDPFQIFVQLLSFSPSSYFEAMSDFRSLLLPAFSRKRRSQVAVFIDNVDECFSGHLERERRSGLFGYIAQDFWHDAQIGLLTATRQIANHNTHIKIFATIRTEAVCARQSQIQDLANVRSHMIEVKFYKEDLLHIFEENIKREERTKLVEPDATNPLRRFLGSDALSLRHNHTGRIESTFDYILRHTFGRPRDLMTIGQAISEIRPERRNHDNIRDAINRAARSIGEAYLTEVSPHFDWFYRDLLFSKINTNVLRAEDLVELSDQYERDAESMLSGSAKSADQSMQSRIYSIRGASAFADLHAAGLLGVVQRHPTEQSEVQSFTSIFDMHTRIARDLNSVPVSSFYLVHNVLGSYIRRRYPVNWVPHTVNIISPDTRWFEDDDLWFVLNIDVCGSTAARADPDIGPRFTQTLEDAVCKGVESTVWREVPWNGDSIMLVDRSGYVLVRAAHRIARYIKDRLGLDVRAGLDFGLVRFAGEMKMGSRKLDSGVAITRSARLAQSSAAGVLLTFPHLKEKLLVYEVDWDFLSPEQLGARNLRAKKSKQGWSIGEKDAAGKQVRYPGLFGLRLHGLKFEA
jgi:hypothetical protein